ncbi:PIG-L deacetylase family protein [Candidatus Caldatribacterium sp. SIUC1]|uniref:PIG-L deacetylase family protein n=1 Tax=Candidatus Caldatribacterium sp. SIUC1 TaxID=3418365 RepID=UPI003F68C2C9
MKREEFMVFDLRRRQKSPSLDLLFPGWQEGDERVVIFSPHDDDALLGAGYLLQAVPLFGGEVYIVVFCNGSGGYSVIEHKNVITALRARETTRAYAKVGILPERIYRLEYDDYSVWPFIGWKLSGGEEGTVQKVIPLLRRLRATRVVLPNGHREHLDHTAVFMVGAFDAPQVGDPVMADWGESAPVRSVLQYAVWSDFAFDDALCAGDDLGVRANRALLAPSEAEERVQEAMREFRTQARIVEGLLAARKEREFRNGFFLEVYLAFDPRPKCVYEKYLRRVEEIERGGGVR